MAWSSLASDPVYQMFLPRIFHMLKLDQGEVNSFVVVVVVVWSKSSFPVSQWLWTTNQFLFGLRSSASVYPACIQWLGWYSQMSCMFKTMLRLLQVMGTVWTKGCGLIILITGILKQNLAFFGIVNNFDVCVWSSKHICDKNNEVNREC